MRQVTKSYQDGGLTLLNGSLVQDYYQGRKHIVHPCVKETVDLVAQIYAIDAAILGYNFSHAYYSCSHYGKTSL